MEYNGVSVALRSHKPMVYCQRLGNTYVYYLLLQHSSSGITYPTFIGKTYALDLIRWGSVLQQEDGPT